MSIIKLSPIETSQLELMLNTLMPKEFDWWIECEVLYVKLVVKKAFIVLKLKLDGEWAYKSFREFHYSSSFDDELTLGDIVGYSTMNKVKLGISQCMTHLTGDKYIIIPTIQLELIDKIEESKINKKPLIKDLQTMDFSLEDAEEELKSLVKWFNSLPNELTLYRIIVADKKEDINLKKPGSHYSDSRKDLKTSHSFTSGYGENKFIIKVKADKSLVDVNATLSNRILYPNENEITLKNKGEGVEILSVRKIKNSLNEEKGNQNDAKKSVLNLLNNFGLYKTMEFTGLNIIDLCNFLGDSFKFTVDRLSQIIPELFQLGVLNKNVNEFELGIDYMNGTMHWWNNKVDALATPFWDGYSGIPIDITYYNGREVEEYRNIALDYGGELYFKNIDELIEWFNYVYCPLIYHQIKDMMEVLKQKELTKRES